MVLQSLQYCALLVAVAAVYLHLPVRMQPVFLLGASWVFYALAMPAMLPVTIALAVFTYLCGRGLAWRGGAHKTAFLRLGVIGMLGILAFFKYNGLLGGVLHGWRAVAMQLGISFTSIEGEVVNEKMAVAMLSYFLKKIQFRPGIGGGSVLVNVPCGLDVAMLNKHDRETDRCGMWEIDFV